MAVLVFCNNMDEKEKRRYVYPSVALIPAFYRVLRFTRWSDVPARQAEG